VGALKELLSSQKIDCSDCLEKAELVKRAKENKVEQKTEKKTTKEKIKRKAIFEHRAVGPLQCNMSIIGDPESKKAVIVDPGGDPEVILELVQKLKLEVVQIVVTHAHFDHFLAAEQVKKN